MGRKELEKVRLDKWIWSVRLYKNRGEATAACSRNEVSVDGQVAKPARMIQVGMKVTARIKGDIREFEVTQLAEKPVGNDRGHLFYNDLSDPELLEKLEEEKKYQYKVSTGQIHSLPKTKIKTPRIAQKYTKDKKGRPTKKQRRDRDEMFEM